MKKCPYCAEQIQDDAIKCRYCGSMLTGAAPPSSTASTAVWLQDVRNLLLQGQKIEAIKFVRQQTHAGLKDAKDFVDALERGGTPLLPQATVTPPQSTGCSLVILAILIAVAAALATYFIRR